MPDPVPTSNLEKLRDWSGTFKDISIGGVAMIMLVAGKYAFEEFKSMQQAHIAAVEKLRADADAKQERQVERFLQADDRRQTKIDAVVDKLSEVARTLGDTAREVRRASSARPLTAAGAGQ